MESGKAFSCIQPMPDGYSKLSAFQGKFPQFAIFRRFAALNAQTLLYMQAELSHLELEMNEIILEDCHSGDEKRRAYNQDWWTLNQASQEGRSPAQLRKILEIREKLQRYSMEHSEDILTSLSAEHACFRCCNTAAE